MMATAAPYRVRITNIVHRDATDWASKIRAAEPSDRLVHVQNKQPRRVEPALSHPTLYNKVHLDE